MKSEQTGKAPAVLRVLGTKSFLALNLVLFVFMGWALVGEWIRGRDLTEQVAAKTLEADQMQEEYVKAAAEARVMESGYLAEREARLKLNLQKPGEQVVVIKGLGGEENTETAEEEIIYRPPSYQLEPESNFAGWWRYFFQ